jgi:hypothetical protein
MFRSHSQLSLNDRTDLPIRSAYLLRHALPTACLAYPPASLHRSIGLRWYWNFNQLSIAYGFRPRLRSRLTLSGRSFLRNPWVFGGQDSHLSFRYSYRHSHFPAVHGSLRYRFYPLGTLPYPFWKLDVGSQKLERLPGLDQPVQLFTQHLVFCSQPLMNIQGSVRKIPKHV